MYKTNKWNLEKPVRAGGRRALPRLLRCGDVDAFEVSDGGVESRGGDRCEVGCRCARVNWSGRRAGNDACRSGSRSRRGGRRDGGRARSRGGTRHGRRRWMVVIGICVDFGGHARSRGGTRHGRRRWMGVIGICVVFWIKRVVHEREVVVRKPDVDEKQDLGFSDKFLPWLFVCELAVAFELFVWCTVEQLRIILDRHVLNSAGTHIPLAFGMRSSKMGSFSRT